MDIRVSGDDMPLAIMPLDTPAGAQAAAQASDTKPGRRKSCAAAQMQIIIRGMEKNHGPKTIVDNHEDAGLTVEGVKSVLKRMKKRSKDPERKSGSGRKRTTRTEENIATVKGILDDNPRCSLNSLVAEARIKRTAVQRIVKQDLGLKSYAQVKMQRVLEPAREKRLALCTRQLEQMNDNFALDLRLVFFAVEK